MVQIRNKEVVAGTLKAGLRAVAEMAHTTVERVDQEFAPRLSVEARTLKSWKNPSSVPDNLDDEKLLGLAWLIIEQGTLDLAWLTSLLEVTSLPVADPPTPGWVRACFKAVRVGQGVDNHFAPPDEATLEQVLARLFPTKAAPTLTPLTSASAARGFRLESPGEVVALDSSFYMPRPADQIALSTLATQGFTLVIKGPRQLGKSSLLIRITDQAARLGKRVALLDFQRFEHANLVNPELFYRQFCSWLTYLLKMDNRVEQFWVEPLGNIQRCTSYLEEYLLPQLSNPLLLAMDEVDHLFDTSFRSDFFGMLRSWHNARQMNPIWKQLDLVLVTSTQPYQFVEDLNQSPFNVGEIIELEDFGLEQLTELNRLHGSPFQSEEVEQLLQLVGGQPYLVRQALYMVSTGRFAVSTLFEQAAQERGPFGDHLRYFWQRLHHNAQLVEALREVLCSATCSDATAFWRLQGAGLIKRAGKAVVPRCQLYATYFGEKLL